jgi:general secretion pathway protein C
MLSTSAARSHWLSGVRRGGPRLISLSLAILIVVELVRIGATLWGPSSGDPPGPRMPQRRPPAIVTGVDVARIVSAHLFGALTSDQNPQNPMNAPRSTADLGLAGTIATQSPRRGMAIIGERGQFKVYSVGEHVGAASLQLVYADRVILERNGALEALRLPRALPASDPSAETGARTPAAGQETAVIDRIADSSAENDNDGKMLGIRVVPGQDASAFTHSGLKGGDLIVAVNGTRLDAHDRGEEIWKQASSGSTVTVVRLGKTQDITLNFPP